MLLFFGILGLIAAVYTTVKLMDLWNAVVAGEQGIVQDTSIGFGYTGLILPGVYLLSVYKRKFSLGNRTLNILSVTMLVILMLLAFITNHIVSNHLTSNGYVVCGYTEKSSGGKHPYWMPVERCESKKPQ